LKQISIGWRLQWGCRLSRRGVC